MLAQVGLLILLLLFVVAVLCQRRGRAQRRSAEAEKWERVRRHLSMVLQGREGDTVVLTTGYQVPNEEAGNSLRQSLEERWSDRGQVIWQAEPPGEPHWAVVMTSETVLVTPLLQRQWLARMRTVCETYGCQMSSIGVHWGGSPPTEASVLIGPR